MQREDLIAEITRQQKACDSRYKLHSQNRPGYWAAASLAALFALAALSWGFSIGKAVTENSTSIRMAEKRIDRLERIETKIDQIIERIK